MKSGKSILAWQPGLECRGRKRPGSSTPGAGEGESTEVLLF